jgi:hypothetical protein
MAPMLGSSVYTWTSVIGIVLLGTALGNNLGGKMIDKRNSHQVGALFFWLASVSILCIPIMAGFTKNIALLDIPFWIAIMSASIALFLIPSFF